MPCTQSARMFIQICTLIVTVPVCQTKHSKGENVCGARICPGCINNLNICLVVGSKYLARMQGSSIKDVPPMLPALYDHHHSHHDQAILQAQEVIRQEGAKRRALKLTSHQLGPYQGQNCSDASTQGVSLLRSCAGLVHRIEWNKEIGFALRRGGSHTLHHLTLHLLLLTPFASSERGNLQMVYNMFQ